MRATAVAPRESVSKTSYLSRANVRPLTRSKEVTPSAIHNADRVATPLVLANNALAAGGDVLVWVSLEAMKLARREAASELEPKSFPPVADLLRRPCRHTEA